MSTSSVTLTTPADVPFIEIERELDTTVETYDVRTGGSDRFKQSACRGEQHAFHRVIHVARPNDFIVQTFAFDGVPDVVSIRALTFRDLGGGRTRPVSHSTYPSQEARDGMVASGMAKGVTEGYERLDAVLALR